MPSDRAAHEPARRCAILAGGAGSRLGGRKATASLAGRPLVEHVAAAARSAGLEPLIVAKPDTALEGIATEILIEPSRPRHPLTGVATALEQVGEPLVCCPCDVPLVPPRLLAALAGASAEVCVASEAGRPHPLLGRYEPALAGRLHAAAEAGRAATETVIAAGARRLEIGDLRLGAEQEAWALANVNGPADLERLEAHLAGSGRPPQAP